MGTITDIHWDTPPFHWDRPYGRVIAASGVPIDETGTTGAQTVLEKTIPAGTIETGDQLIIRTSWSCDNNANVKTTLIRLDDGTASPTVHSVPVTSSASLTAHRQIGFDGTNAHWLDDTNPTGWAKDTTTYNSFALDITKDIDVQFIINNADAGDTTSLASYVVELIKAV